ncbi:acetyltransferase-like isoleucine patch superfamily enzyme [Flavobacterium chryseum]|uniref:acyltransferase n=1 Tax=Flavobacterium sp. P3160 TaxID=2512113 RepID=UPI00105B9130|nr:acyltransferase [Flavobacterium sp. P3160]TDO77436.1 acetyltransferase-like isoleucine patch superfamily enzyme [Flavobacterium sp. P3160]
MLIIDIINKIKYNLGADRIGPDLPFTHWRLYYKKQMLSLCKKKFKHFSDTADFRPGAYAVGCSKIKIGNRVVVRPGVMLFGESESLETSIIIEDNVMMGCGVHIYINNHKFDQPDIPLIDQGYYPDEAVILKNGCWIGANSILLPGITIGNNSVIGAGSIVTKSIPDGVVAVGSPAKIIKKI